jgi:hypothetical protein
MVRSRQIERAKGLPFEYGYLYAVPAEAETKDENAKSLSVMNPSNFPVSSSDFAIPLNGKLPIGGSSWNLTNKVAYAFRRVYISAASNIVAVWLYYKLAGAGGTRQVYAAIYSDSAGSPNARLGTGSLGITTGGPLWGRISVGTIAVSAGYYWIGVLWNPELYDGTFTLYYDAETNACAQDGTVATLPDPFGTPAAWLNYGVTSLIETDGAGQFFLYGAWKQGQSFTAIAGTCHGVFVRVKKTGTFTGSLTAELRSVSFTGTVLASGSIPYSSIDTDFTNVLISFNSAVTLTVSTTYYLCFYMSDGLGDVSNCYVLASGADLVTGNAAWYWDTWRNLTAKDICFGVPMFVLEKHITQENITSVAYANIYGANWFMQSILALRFCPFRRLTLYLKKIGTPADSLYASLYAIDPATGKPTGQPLVTGSIAAASVSTTVSWLNIDFSWPMNFNTQYVIVLSSPLSVNSSNCYMAGYVTSNPYAGGQYGASTDSGVTWTLTAANDFCFDVWVPTEQLVFGQNFSPTSPTDLTWEAAKVYLGLWAKLKSLDGQYMTLRLLVDSVEQTDAGTSYDGVSAREDSVLDPAKSVPQTTWNLKIYGAGDGVITALRYMRHHYCDTQTITPATFGVPELILHQGKIMAGSLIILNDDFKQRQYCPDNSDPKTLDFTGAPLDIIVRKVYFAKGQSILSFLGR